MNSLKMRSKCAVCGGRGRRACPTLDGIVCTTCCGSKRGSKIICAPECSHFPFGPNSYDQWLRIDDSFARKMSKYVADHIGRFDFERIIKENTFDDADRNPDSALSSFGLAVHLILFVRKNSGGNTLADQWEQEGWRGLNNDERVMMRFRRHSFPTVIEVQRVIDSQAFECVDLFEEQPKPFLVYDRNTASRVIRFTRLLTLVCRYPHFWRIGPAGLEIPQDLFPEFAEELRQRAVKEGMVGEPSDVKKYLKHHFAESSKLVTRLSEARFQRMLRSMDTNHCIVEYDLITDRTDIETILLTKPDFQAEDTAPDPKQVDPPGTSYYTWLRLGESKKLERRMPSFFRHGKTGEDGVGVIGNISLLPDRLVVETFSRQKIEFAKKMIDKYFGERICFRSENVENLARKITDKMDKRKEEIVEVEPDDDMIQEEDDESSIPSDVQAQVLESFYERHYHKMMNDRIPMLNGLTPRQASKRSEMRPRLIEFMKLHLHGVDKNNRERGTNIQIDWMLKELGLTELIS